MAKPLPGLLIMWLLAAVPSRAQEVGVASFYHDYFNGKTTASGEKYDPNKLTAAHKSLPIGTLIKITNLDNDKSVVVRINDRGPYVKSRILDLSRMAAAQLDFLKTGYAHVSFVVIENNLVEVKDTFTEDVPDDKFYVVNQVDSTVKLGYGVKLGSFDDPKIAFVISKDLKTKYNSLAYIQTVKLIKGSMYRVFVGNFVSQAEAEQLRQSLKKAYPDCKVVSYDNFK